MFKCLSSVPKHAFRLQSVKSPATLIHTPRSQLCYSTAKKKPEAILTELVYGRKRIYTSLQTISKSKSATASKSRIAAPITTTPMSWEWVQPQEENTNSKQKREWYRLRQNSSGMSLLNSFKQNMREMFLPVG